MVIESVSRETQNSEVHGLNWGTGFQTESYQKHAKSSQTEPEDVSNILTVCMGKSKSNNDTPDTQMRF